MNIRVHYFIYIFVLYLSYVHSSEKLIEDKNVTLNNLIDAINVIMGSTNLTDPNILLKLLIDTAKVQHDALHDRTIKTDKKLEINDIKTTTTDNEANSLIEENLNVETNITLIAATDKPKITTSVNIKQTIANITRHVDKSLTDLSDIYVSKEHTLELQTFSDWEQLMFNSNYSNLLKKNISNVYQNIQINKMGHAKLRVINAGATSTGNQLIHEIFCDRNLHAVQNYKFGCKFQNRMKNPFFDTYRSMYLCTKYGRSVEYEPACNTTIFMNQIVSGMQFITREYEAYSNTPMSWFAGVIVLLNPKVKMVLSLKHPIMWALYRSKDFVRDRNPEILCAPKYWGHPNLLHPFDILGCLNLGEGLIDASNLLVNAIDLYKAQGIRKLANAFVQSTIINANLVERYNLLLVNYDDNSYTDIRNMSQSMIHREVSQQVQDFLDLPTINSDLYSGNKSISTKKNTRSSPLTLLADEYVKVGSNYNLSTVSDWEQLMFYSNYSLYHRNPIEVYKNISLDDVIPRNKVKLNIIDSGAGTTGTRTIHDIFCLDKLHAVHNFHFGCNWQNNLKSYFYTTYKKLFSCTKYYKSEEFESACNSTVLINEIIFGMAFIVREYEAFSDTPINWFATILTIFNPDLVTVLTLKHPLTWAFKRQGEHSDFPDLLCHPKYWGHPNILHPFDLVGCLTIGPDASKVLIDSNTLCYIHGHRKYASAFIQSNIVNANLIPRHNLLIINFDDINYVERKLSRQDIFNEVQQQLNNFLQNHSVIGIKKDKNIVISTSKIKINIKNNENLFKKVSYYVKQSNITLTLSSISDMYVSKEHIFDLNTYNDWDNLFFHSNYSYIHRNISIVYKDFEKNIRKMGHAKLKIINAGGVATGNEMIHDIFCDYKMHSVHNYVFGCNHQNRMKTTFFLSYRSMYLCTKYGASDEYEPACNTTIFMNQIVSGMQFITREYEAYSNTPMYWFSGLMLLFNPKLKVILTLRHPLLWAVQRSKSYIKERNPEILCAPKYWGHPNLLHPFDILGCLTLGNDASKLLINAEQLYKQYGVRKLASAFLQTSIVTSNIIPKTNLLIIYFNEDSISKRNITQYKEISSYIKTMIK